MQNTTIAIDLAKSIFEVAVSHRPGHVAQSKRLTRARLLPFLANLPSATVLLEACGSAHFWARRLQELGHDVQLLPAHRVRPYVLGNKTDRADARALLEAFRNQQIRPVPVKSVPQQALASLHRLRSGWLATRTARLNAVRGLLREFGVTIPQGAHHVVPRVEGLVAAPESAIPEALRSSLTVTCAEIRALEASMQDIERQLRSLGRQLPVVSRLQTIPGIGLLSATGLVAFVGDVRRFPSGRHFASYLGLVPRERSSGYTRRLGRITKRGDVYLRMLLIHGARSVLWTAKGRSHVDRLRAWALTLENTRGHNKAAVALANKLARIAWKVWITGGTFESQPAT